MIGRLVFAVAIYADPDILPLDEVLSVGDHSFKEKCLDRLDAFCASGRTLVLTSHDRERLFELCTHAVWLDQGCIRMQGQPEEVLSAYHKMQN
jgi:lipopolysaccharide transport system ATP-binding protein